ncbi:MAG: substrate-binding domain-containing protein, partial [Gammaproteobacteria bacterium]|nr:substrate-binding domain-containing protein [Gammaproteobacteria bacterium]
MTRSFHILTWLCLLALVVGCSSLTGRQITTSDANTHRKLSVVTSGGFAAAYNSLAPRFAAATGIELHTEYGSSSGGAPDSIPARLERGESFDLIILSQSSLNRLTEIGEVRPDTRRDLARSSIGMVVGEGAHVPDISTPDLFLDVVMDAESIGYSASASGTYLSTVLFPRLGLWDQLQRKSTRILSERVAAVVARGEVQIGFQQISEILPVEGATFVG